MRFFFISTIYLILNFDADFSDTSKLTTVLINFLDYLSAFFDLNFLNMKIIFLIFIITLKNFLTIFQNWFFLNYIYRLSAKKSKDIYKNFLNLKYQSFIKK